MTGRENRALAGKGRAAKEQGVGWGEGGGEENKRREVRDKENSEAEKLCFLLMQWQSGGGAAR